MENMYTGKSSRNPNSSLYIMLFFGLALMAFGIYLYFDLAAWENSSDQKSMNSMLWLIYDVSGKIGVAGFFAIIGAFLIFTGYKQSKDLKKVIEDAKNNRHSSSNEE